MTITTFQQIKEIIEPIPADQFCTKKFENEKGQCCFLGHIHKHIDGNAYYGDGDGHGARELTRLFFVDLKISVYRLDGTDVNNRNNINGYTEPIIKDRLMHMIEDGIKWETKKN